MAQTKENRLDPKSWRETAAQFRALAQSTREAERQRIFPVLAEECETVARDLERRSTNGA